MQLIYPGIGVSFNAEVASPIHLGLSGGEEHIRLYVSSPLSH